MAAIITLIMIIKSIINYNITCARIISLASGLSFSARGQGLYTATITMTPTYFHRKIKKISTVEPKDIINS